MMDDNPRGALISTTDKERDEGKRKTAADERG